jgi:hypothetical protein
VKEIFLGNLATKGMALLLALLTWGYLYTQEHGLDDIELEFLPSPDLPDRDLASIRYFDDGGAELQRGSWLKARVQGPKGDVRSLRKKFYKCQFEVGLRPRESPAEELKVVLQRKDFDLPEKFDVAPLPSATITVRYAKYVDREIELAAGQNHYEGEPRPGYQVKAVTPNPPRIRAKVRADRSEIPRVPVQKPRVDGKFANFTTDPTWPLDLSDPAMADLRIVPLQPFSVHVEIAPIPGSRRITVDLHVAASLENEGRVSLGTKSITVELRGREDLIRDAPESAFFAYVVVTDKDLDTPGPKNITEFGCHVLDPRYRDQVTVTLMADQLPENRQIKIEVRPK